MANAKQAPLTFLPEPYGEERPATNVETEEALQTLLQALENRQRPRFDPRMLAIAEGLLGPTKTGSGFEAIGRALGRYREVDELERQREVELAQQKLGLIGQMGEIQRRKQRDIDFENYFKRMEDPVPGQMGQEVAGSDRFAPPGLGNVVGIKVMEGNPALLGYKRDFNRESTYLRSLYRDGKLTFSEALEKEMEFQKKAMEAQRNRYNVTDKFIIDLGTGLKYSLPQGDLVERQIVGIPGVDGTYKIPANIAAKMDVFQSLGDRENYLKEARRALNMQEEKPAPVGKGDALAQAKAPEKPEAKPSATAPTGSSVIKSREQLETETAARKAEAEATAKAKGELEGKRATDIIEAGDKAGASRRLASQFKAFANRPDAAQIFGFAARPELRYQIVRLLTSGVGLPGASVGIPELMESVRAMELTPEQMAVFQTFAQLTTELSLRMSEAVKGSVSNYEQGLFQKAVVNVEDLPTTIKMKADMLDARAAFDQEVARKYEDSGMSVSQFRRSPEYRNAVKQYEDKLTLIVEGKPREEAKKQGLTADQIRAEAARRSGR